MLSPAPKQGSRLLYRYVLPTVGISFVAYLLYKLKRFWSGDDTGPAKSRGPQGDDQYHTAVTPAGAIIASDNNFLSKVPRAFTLTERIPVTHNADIFRFALPDPGKSLGLLPGQHLFVTCTIDGRDLVRPYNPITTTSDVGHFDLLIKLYEGGEMSEHVFAMKPGDTIDMIGPGQSFHYKPGCARHIVMLIGGTGLTPMVPIIKTIVSNPEDTTNVSVIYANVTEGDILLREWLDSLDDSPQVNVHHNLLRPPDGWTGGDGFVTAEVIQAHLTRPYSDVLVLLCGPPGFDIAMRTHFNGMDFPEQQVVGFV